MRGPDAFLLTSRPPLAGALADVGSEIRAVAMPSERVRDPTAFRRGSDANPTGTGAASGGERRSLFFGRCWKITCPCESSPPIEGFSPTTSRRKSGGSSASSSSS